MSDKSSHTEKPTPRRLEKARREGQFVTSREMVGAVQFLTFAALLSVGAAAWSRDFVQLMRHVLTFPFRASLAPETLIPVIRNLFIEAFLPLMAGGALLLLCTAGVQLALTRFGFSWKKLWPDLKRLSPAAKLRQLPRQNLAAFMQACLILAFFGWIIGWMIWNSAAVYATLPLAGLRAGIAVVGESLSGLLWKAGGVFVLAGAIDLFRQHRRFQAEIRMSRQEIHDEVKEMEGNPLIKARVRRLQRDLRRRRMMSEVATATAVIVNPTHYAVALKYDQSAMPAPVVVAKGKNYLALRIKERAIANGVPIVENPPIAQALYKSVDVGREIPPHLYRAVAEILAYIHRLMQVSRSIRGS